MTQRILILGCPGAGKSTLARRLAEMTGLPLIHLDREYWRPGWVEPDRNAWRERVAELVRRPAWIMDGHHGGTLSIRLAAADAVVFLDFPRWLCVVRVLKRHARWRGRVRDDMGPGCCERFDWAFLWYVWRWRHTSRSRVMAALADFPGEVYTLRRPAGAAQFLDRIAPSRSLASQ